MQSDISHRSSKAICENGKMSNFDVAVVGSVNADLVFSAPRLPEPGETVTGATVFEAQGGKGANQAVASARLEARVALIAAVGNDGAGELVLGSLERSGVDVRACAELPGFATGRASVWVDAEGQNRIVVADGANRQLDAPLVRERLGRLGGARVVLCQLEVPQSAVAAAFAWAHECGGIGILNAAPARPLNGLRPMPNVLIANRGEAQALASSHATDDLDVLAERVSARLEVETVVVTAGALGAVAWSAGQVASAPAVAVPVSDTTGAGDAFAGAFAARLAEGEKDIDELLRYACATGSLATTRSGAAPAMPDRAEVEAALHG
jgi:ribokinase